MRTGDWLNTVSGKRYYPHDPCAEDVDIGDIAHALSNLCRWAGHSPRFYSVAEHSVLVSTQVPRQHALAALLHDATEAYLVDLPRPIKKSLPEYIKLELLNWRVITERFKLDDKLPDCVHYADDSVLLAEKAAFFPNVAINNHLAVMPAHVRIKCLTPKDAKQAFMDRYLDIVNLWPYQEGMA
jgi:hypothetical protein